MAKTLEIVSNLLLRQTIFFITKALEVMWQWRLIYQRLLTLLTEVYSRGAKFIWLQQQVLSLDKCSSRFCLFITSKEDIFFQWNNICTIILWQLSLSYSHYVFTFSHLFWFPWQYLLFFINLWLSQTLSHKLLLK